MNGTSKFTHRQNIIEMGETPNKSAVEMSLPLHEKTRYNTCLHDKDLYRCFFKLKWSDEIMRTITRKYHDNPILWVIQHCNTKSDELNPNRKDTAQYLFAWQRLLQVILQINVVSRDIPHHFSQIQSTLFVYETAVVTSEMMKCHHIVLWQKSLWFVLRDG